MTSSHVLNNFSNIIYANKLNMQLHYYLHMNEHRSRRQQEIKIAYFKIIIIFRDSCETNIYF